MAIEDAEFEENTKLGNNSHHSLQVRIVLPSDNGRMTSDGRNGKILFEEMEASDFLVNWFKNRAVMATKESGIEMYVYIDNEVVKYGGLDPNTDIDYQQAADINSTSREIALLNGYTKKLEEDIKILEAKRVSLYKETEVLTQFRDKEQANWFEYRKRNEEMKRELDKNMYDEMKLMSETRKLQLEEKAAASMSSAMLLPPVEPKAWIDAATDGVTKVVSNPFIQSMIEKFIASKTNIPGK